MSVSIEGMDRLRIPMTFTLKGTVSISEAPWGHVAPHPVLYRRNGRLYLPDGLEATDGVLVGPRHLYSSRNHITKAGRGRASRLISGLNADFPDRIGVGDGGIQTGTSSPKVVLDTQTSLSHEVTRELVSQRVFSDDGLDSVTFVAVFKTAGSYQFAQPGQTRISEIGLFARDGTLMAAHNFAPIPVDVHRIGVLVEWEWVVL